MPDGSVYSVVDAAQKVLALMKNFYRDFSEEVREILAFEEEKLIDPEKRYAWRIRKEFRDGYVKKGLELARKRQEEANV